MHRMQTWNRSSWTPEFRVQTCQLSLSDPEHQGRIWWRKKNCKIKENN